MFNVHFAAIILVVKTAFKNFVLYFLLIALKFTFFIAFVVFVLFHYFATTM